MSADRALSPAALAAGDPSGQIGEVLALAEHLRDALWRVESANIRPSDTPGGLVVAGVDGAADGAPLARAALGGRLRRPLTVTRDYALPPWTAPDTSVLCVSYSGDDAETVAVYDAARALGAPRVVVTTGGQLAEHARADHMPVVPLPGGFRPRAAVGYTLVTTLEIARLCGVGGDVRVGVEAAAVMAGELAERWGPRAPDDSSAKSLARELDGTVAQIGGAGLTVSLAYRWKASVNQSAKRPACWFQLPRALHGELDGLRGGADRGRFSVILLDDQDTESRLRAEIGALDASLTARGLSARVVQTLGETRLERLVSLLLLGDLAAIYLAVLGGVDPA